MYNTFIISKNKDKLVDRDLCLAKLMEKMRNFNEVTIYVHLGCETDADIIINKIIRSGGWIKEYDKRTSLTLESKKDKSKYTLDVYEYLIRRDVHNQLKED
ncbi:MAG: hypothetical protein AABY07_05785 [Nanoarchaeota archaeon]